MLSTVLTNTILIPFRDGMAESHPLQETSIVSDIQKFQTNFDEKKTVRANDFSVYFTFNDKSVCAVHCESVKNLEVSREVETLREGGNADYQTKLPGDLKYRPVIFNSLMTSDGVFLEWLINGADKGAAQKADIEIRVGFQNEYVSYILRDAFPISWNLGTMGINVSGLVTQDAVVTYTIQQGVIPIENLTVAYSRMDFRTVG